MNSASTNRFDHVSLPIYELNEDGSVKPNSIFHRPFDYLHSRCVEYPFAASQLGDAKKILDVGTVKSDRVWISWLESLPIEVHATDYDEPFVPFNKMKFHKGDLRALPLESGIFDKILVVSVIEHIGLSDPQVVSKDKPLEDSAGDLAAFKELLRVLKKGGSIIMTLPFGTIDEIVLGSARNYTIKSIEKFNKLAEPIALDYYEYQHSMYRQLFSHERKIDGGMKKLKNIFKGGAGESLPQKIEPQPGLSGLVTWRKVSLGEAKATNKTHIDGVLCGVWKKLRD